MQHRLIRRAILALGLGLWAAPLAHAQLPAAKGEDHALVDRYPGSTMIYHDHRSGGSYAFVTGGKANRAVQASSTARLSGDLTLSAYQGPGGKTSLEVLRELQSDAKAKGLTQVYECSNVGSKKLCPSITELTRTVFPVGSALDKGACRNNPRYALFRKGADTRVAILTVECEGEDSPRTLVSVVEPAAARREAKVVQAPTAADIAKAFESEGRIALYGIYFDTGEAKMKADSRPTLDAIAAALTANPALSLVIVGYTDSVGDFDENLALSRERAEAIVGRLIADYKVPVARLSAFGAGETGPRASNATEQGRAQNRRVELVPR